MAVRTETRRGQRIQVIDIRYRKADGTKGRYRHDAEVQTLAAARAEERRLLANIAMYGQVFEPGKERVQSAPAEAVLTFGEVVAKYRATYMETDLKVTTRRGYESVLNSVLLPKLKDVPIAEVNGEAASQLDLALVKQKRKRKGKIASNTRNNAQIVLRSVLKFAKATKLLDELPSGLPRLKKIEQMILAIPSDEDVGAILKKACPTHRVAFGLMAFAGLRPNEVRALLRLGLQLQRDSDGAPVGGFLTVREGRSHGETHTPKTGQRDVPVAPRLAQLLGPLEQGPRDGHLARTKDKEPWGQSGLAQAFERTRDRAGLAGWSIYALRHYAITDWLRRGIPVHVVQKMAGHKHLSTTQHYVHFLKGDLVDAAKLLDARLG
jgi:integrase